jgi:hypothetical protein
VVWRGAWAADEDYSPGDIVTHPSPVAPPCLGGALLTYFCLSFHTSVAVTNEPAPGGTPLFWHEMTSGALIVDGLRAMTCNLDMDSHEVDNVEAIDFTLAPTHAHAPGGFHWDAGLEMPVADTTSSAGDVQLPMASVYVRVIQQAVGGGISAGSPLAVVGYDGSGFIAVDRAYASVGSPPSREILGIAPTDLPLGVQGWACIGGYVRIPGAFAGLSGTTYLDSNTPSGLQNAPPQESYDIGCWWRVRMGYVENDDLMIVNVERTPGLQELSDVQSADNAPPQCGDVLVRHVDQSSGCGSWIPTGLWTEIELDFESPDAPGDMKVFEWVDNQRVHSSDQRVTMVASAKPAAGRDEDEAEFDCFVCAARTFYDGVDWRIRAYVHSLRGRIVGPYVFQYMVSNADEHNCYYNPV